MFFEFNEIKAIFVVKELNVFSHIPWLKKQKSLAI